jgi:hypothetical protein
MQVGPGLVPRCPDSRLGRIWTESFLLAFEPPQVLTTSAYLHVAVDDQGLGAPFEFER